MKNIRKISISLMLSFLILLGMSAAVSAATAPIVYVDTDGSGDFNCDGVDDQVQIQKALDLVASNSEFTTVYLRGPNTYWISDNLHVGDNTILEGDKNAVIKLIPNAGWPAWKDLIEEKDSSGNHDITIRGFEIDGNSANQPERLGRGYYGLIEFGNAYNIEVYDMYLHDAHGDGVCVIGKPGYPTNIKFYNNRVVRMGHEGLYAIDSTYVEAYNNDIITRTNSALRADRSNHIKFHDNEIRTVIKGDSTGPGIELQQTSGVLMDDIEIYNNKIYDLNGAAIWMFATSSHPLNSAANVHIYNNVIYNVGNYPIGWASGIVIQGFHNTIIENNVFDGSVQNGIKYYNWPTKPTSGSGYKTIVRDNIFMNTKQGGPNPSDSGYALYNDASGTHTFVSENNILYNNVANYKNTFSSKDISANPMLVDPANHDYSFKSSSPYANSGIGPSADASSGGPSEGDGTTPDVDPDVPSGEVTVYDNRLKQSSPTSNLAGSTYLDVGNIEGVGSYRDVIWFDLSDYNSTDIVDKATLSLFWYYEGATRSNDAVVEIYKPLDWDTDSVTWNSPWTNSGGDWVDSRGVSQGSVPYDSLTFSSTASPDNRYYEFDVTELVQDYVSGDSKNNGFFIKARVENNDYIAFYSSDWGNANQRPVLNIDHRISGGISGGDGDLDINKAPVLSTIGSKTIAEMDRLTVDASATDPNGDSLTYSASGLPTGATINPVTGVFEWTPSMGQEGTYKVTFKVSDGYLSDSELVTITVSKVAHKPTITSLQPLDNSVFEEGDVISISADAHDEYCTDLSYIIKVDGVIRSTGASYNWVTDSSSEGTHTIEVIVSDGANQAVEQFSVTINEAGISFDPMLYDTDLDGSLSKKEVYTAIDDYYSGQLKRNEINKVVYEYFNGR